MSGAGNDFVMIDNRKRKLRLSRVQIAKICDRHFGVGADGLLLAKDGPKGVDYTMEYYNADGSLADMCGNGARCFARFVQHFKKSTKRQVTFMTGAGLIEARFSGSEVSINMTAPHSLQTLIKVPTTTGNWTTHSLNTGVPHAVCFVTKVEAIDIKQLGSEIRHHSLFKPKGTNVNFAQVTGPNSITVRTYERGVEGETLACGTGVVACAILAHALEGVAKPVKVTVRSGAVMTVDFNQKGQVYSDPTLKGPASVIFTGEIKLE